MQFIDTNQNMLRIILQIQHPIGRHSCIVGIRLPWVAGPLKSITIWIVKLALGLMLMIKPVPKLTHQNMNGLAAEHGFKWFSSKVAIEPYKKVSYETLMEKLGCFAKYAAAWNDLCWMMLCETAMVHKIKHFSFILIFICKTC